MYKEILENNYDNFFNVKDEYKSLGVSELQEICRNEARNFRICALNIEGDLNIGMMMRSASLFGCEKAYIFGRRRIDRRSLVGTQNYLSIEHVDALNEDDTLSLDVFKEFVDKQAMDGYVVVAFEQGGVSLEDVYWENDVKYTFVFGNESNGIPEEFLKHVHVISIPQLGVLRSFNVAATANIALWDYVTKTKYGYIKKYEV